MPPERIRLLIANFTFVDVYTTLTTVFPYLHSYFSSLNRISQSACSTLQPFSVSLLLRQLHLVISSHTSMIVGTEL